MKSCLILYPLQRSAPEQRWRWALFDAAQEMLGGGEGALEQIVVDIERNGMAPAELFLMLPGEACLYCVAELPAKQARHAQQALPYAIEDLLSQDIEKMHIVAGDRLERDRWPVFAIAHEDLAPWYHAVKALPWPLHGIFAETACVPRSEDATALRLVVDDSRVVFCAPGEALFAAPLAALEVFLEPLLARQDAAAGGRRVDLFMHKADEQSQALQWAALEQLPGLAFEKHYFGGSAFELLAASAVRQLAALPDLARQPYAGDRRQSASGAARWWPVAAVAGLFFCVHVAMLAGEGWLHQRQAAQYEAQALALYRELFPGQRVVSSPRRQMEGQLRAASGNPAGEDFLALLGQAGHTLKQLPDGDAVTLSNIQFNQQNGRLALELRAQSLDQLDQYKQALSEAGLQASLGSAVREEDGVRGRVTVGGSG